MSDSTTPEELPCECGDHDIANGPTIDSSGKTHTLRRCGVGRMAPHLAKFPREPGLSCKCGVFPLMARHHAIAHGHPQVKMADGTMRDHPRGKQKQHAIDKCDDDPVAHQHKRYHELHRQLGRRPTWEDLNPGERRFRIVAPTPKVT